MEKLSPYEHVILAFDKSTIDNHDVELLSRLRGKIGGVKIGLKAITADIHKPLRVWARANEFFVMEDWKLADTPETVGGAVANIAKSYAWGITVKADGGPPSIKAALSHRGVSRIIGITVLTSLDDQNCARVFGRSSKGKVVEFAEMLAECGAQACVCSPLEVEDVKEHVSGKLFTITPGIRFPESPRDDQKRTATPFEAIKAGADYLVVGRPIMTAADPVAAAEAIAEDIALAFANRSMV